VCELSTVEVKTSVGKVVATKQSLVKTDATNAHQHQVTINEPNEEQSRTQPETIQVEAESKPEINKTAPLHTRDMAIDQPVEFTESRSKEEQAETTTPLAVTVKARGVKRRLFEIDISPSQVKEIMDRWDHQSIFSSVGLSPAQFRRQSRTKNEDSMNQLRLVMWRWNGNKVQPGDVIPVTRREALIWRRKPDIFYKNETLQKHIQERVCGSISAN
jgi:hypothetical protein